MQDSSSQLRQRPRASTRPQPSLPSTPRPEARPQTPVTPPRQQQSLHIAEIAGNSHPSVFENPAADNPHVATPPAQPQRQWFDKVADVLLGVDDASPAVLDPARSRYALICARCSSHNGLVLESLWKDTRSHLFFFAFSPSSAYVVLNFSQSTRAQSADILILPQGVFAMEQTFHQMCAGL